MTSINCTYPVELNESVQNALLAVEEQTVRVQKLKTKAAAEVKSTATASEPEPPQKRGKKRSVSKKSANGSKENEKRPKSEKPSNESVAMKDTEEAEENAEKSNSVQSEKIIKNYMGSKSTSSDNRDKKGKVYDYV